MNRISISKPFLIAPSLLAADLSRLGEEIKALEAAGADVLHFAVMDGHFVPNITFGLPVMEKVRGLTELPFDAHLMITNPDQYLEPFAQAGCNWLSVHIETCPHIHRTIHRIQELGMKAGVVINPGTSLHSLDAIIEEVDYVLVMSVNPGFGGQKFIPQSLERIEELKKMINVGNARIQIDGGIKTENIGLASKAGAEIMVVGTGLLGADNYQKRIEELRTAGSSHID